MLDRCTVEVGLRRAPRIVQTEDLCAPSVLGFWRPTIFLPKQYLETATPSELRFALLHELTHLRRGDPWWLPVTVAARALFFFHPVVHWASRQMELQREILCDRSVVHATENGTEYADFLLEQAWSSAAAGFGPSTSLLGNRTSEITRRIRAILSTVERGERDPARARAGLVLLTLFAALFLALSTAAHIGTLDTRAKIRQRYVAAERLIATAQEKAARIHSGIFQWKQTLYRPADPVPDSSAQVEFSKTSMPKIEFTPEYIQNWIEARKKPYSQTANVTVKFVGDAIAFHIQAEPGLVYAKGFDTTSILAGGMALHQIHSFDHCMIADVNRQMGTSGSIAQFYTAYPHPKLLSNPLSFLAEFPLGDAYTYLTDGDTALADGVLAMQRGEQTCAALARMNGDGLIGSREMQYIVPEGINLVHITSEGSMLNADGVAVFPKQITFRKRAIFNVDRTDRFITPEADE